MLGTRHTERMLVCAWKIIVNVTRLIITVLLGGFGLYRLVRDLPDVWANRACRDALSRLRLARFLAIAVAFAGILLVLPATALGLGALVLVCIAAVALGLAAFLVLSMAVGFLEGYRREER